MPTTKLPSPVPTFDLIAFDWDGTLFDSTAIITRCIQLAVVDVGGTMPSDKDAAYVIGLGLMQALAHAAPDVPPEQVPELGARYQHHYMRTRTTSACLTVSCRCWRT
jgi:phosphoglycolate phosphatase